MSGRVVSENGLSSWYAFVETFNAASRGGPPSRVWAGLGISSTPASGDATMQTRTPLDAAALLVAGALLGWLAVSVWLTTPVPVEGKHAASAGLD